MNNEKPIRITTIEQKSMPPQAYLLGLFSAFDNKFQAVAEKFFKKITWKQFFAIICVNLCPDSPTINKLSELMGSSHQNIKQILLKLERINFVKIIQDSKDKRKQIVILTSECRTFCEENDISSQQIIMRIFKDVNEDSLKTTIQTISKMHENLSLLEREAK